MRPFLLVFLPLLIAYGSTLLWCVDRWNAPTQYFEHCWLVPPLGAFVIWMRRRQWRQVPASPDLRALPMLGAGLLLHLAGVLLTVDSLSAVSLCLTVPAAAWLALGRARLAGLWPVLWLVLFVVPWPMYLDSGVASRLKDVAVDAGAGLANVLGANVERTGALLRPAGADRALWVADACGGLRSLLAMLTLAYCLAFFTGGTGWRRRALLMAVAAPVAVLANVVRIAGLCLFASWWGVPFAEGTGHTIANVLEWAADVAVLLAIDGALGRRLGGGHSAGDPVAAPAVRTAQSLTAVAAALWLVCGPLLWLGFYRPDAEGGRRAERLPLQVAGYQHVARSEAQQRQFEQSLPRWSELLGTADFVWRRYRDPKGAWINLVALFHDSNWKSVHPPQICIEGSNMDIEVDDRVALRGLDGGEAGRIVARGRRDRRLYVTLSLFGTADWESGSYSEFVWHHLPRALLRQSASGFLLRVESVVGSGEDVAAAQARCADFLDDILPAARELLR